MKHSLCALVWFVALVSSTRLSAQIPATFADPAESTAQVIRLIDERLTIMPEVAAWKWLAGQAIIDQERERQVLEQSVADAQAIGLDGAGARRFFDLQIRMARAVQSDSMTSWQAPSAQQPTASRDLNRELRPALDALGRKLLNALYLASTELPHALEDRSVAAQLEQLRRHSGVHPEHVAELRGVLLGVRIRSAPSVQIIKRVGVLRVGTTGDYAPFSSEQHGALHGFDVRLAQDLALHWGVTPKFVRTTWPTLMNDFQEQRFDVAMSGISVTPERAAQAEFSTAYHVDGKKPIARCEDAAKFMTLDLIDKPEVRVIVNPGGTNERFVRERIKRAKILVHADNRTVFDEILGGRADVMITDGIEVELQTRRHPKLCATMRGLLTRAPKALMMSRTSGVAKEVNAWLAPLLASGEVQNRLQLALRDAQ